MITVRLAISAAFFCFTICSSVASGQERVQSDHFGQMGERPTNPELLDWLALTFMKQGWSIKEMLRLVT